MYDVVIIGGGPGGYTAAIYCARARLNTVLLERLSPGGQLGTVDLVDNYPGFPEGINGFELAMKFKDGADRFGIETKLDQVREVDLLSEIKSIKTTKETIQAKTVIIATGARPKLLGVPSEPRYIGNGVSYCATCDGMFYKDKTVAIVGGGNTAATEAIYLSRICKKVYLIHRRDSLRASAVHLPILESTENIEILWNTQIKDLYGEGKLEGVHLIESSGKREYDLPLEGLFVAIGRTPMTEIFKNQLDLDETGYIIADETTVTSAPGVFAVGDVRTKPLRQIVTAAADGATASLFAENYIGQLGHLK